MDDRSPRDLRFGVGLALFGVGGTTVLGFGIAKSTNADLRLWPNPWFIAALVLAVVGVSLMSGLGWTLMGRQKPLQRQAASPFNDRSTRGPPLRKRDSRTGRQAMRLEM